MARQKLNNWFRRRILRKQLSREEEPPPALPDLTARRRPLTPLTPNRPTNGLVGTATEKNGFFELLPIEIRRQILMEAFGDRIMHVGFFFGCPVARPTRADRAKWGKLGRVPHCGYPVSNQDEYPAKLRRESSNPKWHWAGCVCHRDTEASIRSGTTSSELCEDKCLGGYTGWCKHWSGESPGKCFVGAMGWLRSCRQAYVEGIDVLYSTNTLHISGVHLICNLPKLITQQRLAVIRSIEIVWSVKDLVHGTKNSLIDLTHSLKSASLPGLQKLRIEVINYSLYHKDVSTFPESYNEQSLMAESYILQPMDNLMSSLQPHLTDFILVIPRTIFVPRWEYGLEQGFRHEQRIRFEQVWRAIPQTSSTTDTGIETKPGGNGLGYWLRAGQYDVYQPMMCHMGEPPPPDEPRTHIDFNQPEGICVPGSTIGWVFN